MTINVGNEEKINDECDMESGHGFIVPKDKYDLAIDYLTENPEDIYDAWSSPGAYKGKGGELFGFVAPVWTDSSASAKYEGVRTGTCGCLQQIRQAKVEGYDGSSGSAKMAYWERLWDSIANDRSIPTEGSEITVDDLPVFAVWQREIDEKRKQDGFL